MVAILMLYSETLIFKGKIVIPLLHMKPPYHISVLKSSEVNDTSKWLHPACSFSLNEGNAHTQNTNWIEAVFRLKAVIVIKVTQFTDV